MISTRIYICMNSCFFFYRQFKKWMHFPLYCIYPLFFIQYTNNVALYKICSRIWVRLTFAIICWACTHVMYQCLYIWPISPCIMVNVFKLCGRVLNKPYIHLCTKTLATGYWACIHVMYQWHYISYNCYTQSSFYLTSPF